MDEQSTGRSMMFVLSVWKELSSDVVTVCHGSLKATTGQEWTFETLAELDYLLCEIGGWMEPPADVTANTDEIP